MGGKTRNLAVQLVFFSNVAKLGVRFLLPVFPYLKMKFSILDQNHGLTPLKKSQYGHCLKSIFLWSRAACFLTR